MSDALILWIPGMLMLIAGIFYAVMLVVFTRGLLQLERNRQTYGASSPSIFISVVIPARNEQLNIANCLGDLLLQKYPSNLFEVIVVDDQSEDKTAALTAVFAEAHPAFPLRLLRITGKTFSKKQALETGIAAAVGELIITMDADCRCKSEWLSTYASFYNQCKPKMIIGPVALMEGHKAFARMQALEFLSLVATGAGMAGIRLPVLANGANLAFTRDAYFEAGRNSFRPEFASGDDVFLLRAVAEKFGDNSIRFLYDAKALVYSCTQPSLWHFLRQRVRWVSKAKGYRGGYLPLIALNLLFFNLILVAGILLSFIDFRSAVFPVILFGVKCICDIPLLRRFAAFSGQKKLMKYFLPVQLLYPLYVLFTAVAGLVGKFTWKGRKYSN